MLGHVVSLVDPKCDCGSCRAVYEGHERRVARQLKAELTPSLECTWDGDLSEDDLETLANAGWPEDVVRQHVETLRAMASKLLERHTEIHRNVFGEPHAGSTS